MDRTGTQNSAERKARWELGAAIVGALAASVCCLGPLLLLALGVSGAWISGLTLFEPYRPFLIALSLAFLGYAFYRAYRHRPEEECKPGVACARPGASRFNKVSLWIVTVLVVGLIAFPYVVPTGAKVTQSVPNRTERTVLAVHGMTCSGCVLTVQSSLKKVAGVQAAEVSLNPPVAVVEYDPSRASVEDLVRATTRAGYPSEVLNENKVR